MQLPVKGRMNMLMWSKELDVHIESIDAQHQTLIAMINELQEAHDNKMPNVVIGSVLSKLLEYAQYHFDYEENCLVVANYPKLCTHQCIHADFSRELKVLEREFRDGVPGIAQKMLDLLNWWVMNHIMKADQYYSKHLMEAGLQ